MELKLVESRTYSELDQSSTLKVEEYRIGDYNVHVKEFQFVEGEPFQHFDVCTSRSKSGILPEILCDQNILTGEIKGFTIQTMAKGSLDVNGIKRLVRSYEYAVEVVEILTKTFCK